MTTLSLTPDWLEDAAAHNRRIAADMLRLKQLELGQRGERVIRCLDYMIEEGQRMVEACVVSGEIVARGLEEANASTTGYLQTAIRQGMAAAGALICARSPQEAIELQREYLKTRVQAFFHQGAQVSVVTTRTASEAALPFSEYVDDVVDRLSLAAPRSH